MAEQSIVGMQAFDSSSAPLQLTMNANSSADGYNARPWSSCTPQGYRKMTGRGVRARPEPPVAGAVYEVLRVPLIVTAKNTCRTELPRIFCGFPGHPARTVSSTSKPIRHRSGYEAGELPLGKDLGELGKHRDHPLGRRKRCPRQICARIRRHELRVFGVAKERRAGNEASRDVLNFGSPQGTSFGIVTRRYSSVVVPSFDSRATPAAVMLARWVLATSLV